MAGRESHLGLFDLISITDDDIKKIFQKPLFVMPKTKDER